MIHSRRTARTLQVVLRIAGSALVPLACALGLLAAPAGAQGRGGTPGVTVSGQVIDHKTGHPLSGAVVALSGLKRRVVADAQGRFSFRRVRQGAHLLVATQLGYHEWAEAVEVGGADAELTVRLEPDPLVLEGITVKLNLLERRHRAVAVSSRSFDRKWIAASGAPDMQEFLRAHAGVHPVPCGGWGGGAGAQARWAASLSPTSCIFSRGGTSAVSVVIDEVPAMGLDHLAMYRPADVHRVDVYQGGRHVRVYTTWFMEQLARGRRMIHPVAW